MVETKTLVIGGIIMLAAAAAGYAAYSSSKPSALITEKGEKAKTKKKRTRKAPSTEPVAEPKAKTTTAATPVSQAKPQASGMRTWEFPPLGITMEIPEEWSAEEASEASTFITKFSGLAGGDKSQALIVVESHQERLSPEDFLAKFKEVAASMMPVSFINEKRISFAGREGYEALYTQNLAMFGQTGEIKNYVCLTTIDNLGLCFQFTAASTDFDADFETVQEVAKTLTMTPPPSSSVLRVLTPAASFVLPITFVPADSPLPASNKYNVTASLKGEKGSSLSVAQMEEAKSFEEVFEAIASALEGTLGEVSDMRLAGEAVKTATVTKGSTKFSVVVAERSKFQAIVVQNGDDEEFSSEVFSQAQAAEVEATILAFENADLGFNFQFPTYMSVSEGLGQVIVSSARESPIGALTRTTVERMESPQITLSLLADAIKGEVTAMQQQGVPMKIDEQVDVTVNGRPALRIVMTQTNPMIAVSIKEIKTFIEGTDCIWAISSSTTEGAFTPEVQRVFSETADSFNLLA